MNVRLDLIKKYGLLAIVVPMLTGCGSGGSGFLGLGSLFSGVGSILGGSGGGGSLLSGGSDGLASISNPEPATMILMGSGMAAMAYYKNKK